MDENLRTNSVSGEETFHWAGDTSLSFKTCDLKSIHIFLSNHSIFTDFCFMQMCSSKGPDTVPSRVDKLTTRVKRKLYTEMPFNTNVCNIVYIIQRYIMRELHVYRVRLFRDGNTQVLFNVYQAILSSVKKKGCGVRAASKTLS